MSSTEAMPCGALLCVIQTGAARAVSERRRGAASTVVNASQEQTTRENEFTQLTRPVRLTHLKAVLHRAFH